MSDRLENSAGESRRGKLIVLSAPSGAGKSTLAQALAQSEADTVVSISHTTRPMRPGEEDGRHYHFVSVTTFRAMIDDGAFLEHARVFDNYYGTSRAGVETALARGCNVILEIDWQGARLVRERFPEGMDIFILPPSREALLERLEARGQDSAETIEQRMRAAISETSHYAEFEFLVVNDVLETALAELRAILRAEHHECGRRTSERQALLSRLLA